jgi:hypothetical protein
MIDTLIRLQNMGALVQLEHDPRYSHLKGLWTCQIGWQSPEFSDQVNITRKASDPIEAVEAAWQAFNSIATKGIPQSLLAPPVVGVVEELDDAEIPF